MPSKGGEVQTPQMIQCYANASDWCIPVDRKNKFGSQYTQDMAAVFPGERTTVGAKWVGNEALENDAVGPSGVWTANGTYSWWQRQPGFVVPPAVPRRPRSAPHAALHSGQNARAALVWDVPPDAPTPDAQRRWRHAGIISRRHQRSVAGIVPHAALGEADTPAPHSRQQQEPQQQQQQQKPFDGFDNAPRWGHRDGGQQLKACAGDQLSACSSRGSSSTRSSSRSRQTGSHGSGGGGEGRLRPGAIAPAGPGSGEDTPPMSSAASWEEGADADAGRAPLQPGQAPPASPELCRFLEATCAQLGRAGSAAMSSVGRWAAAMEACGVRSPGQLRSLDHRGWASLGLPLGLEMEVKRRLQCENDPGRVARPGAASRLGVRPGSRARVPGRRLASTPPRGPRDSSRCRRRSGSSEPRAAARAPGGAWMPRAPTPQKIWR